MTSCISCGRNTPDVVKFECPKCKAEIVRCSKCRSLSVKYKCPDCGFVGP